MTQKQMQKYKITIDLSRVFALIKDNKMREYAGSYPVIELTACTPDQACFLATKNLIDLLRAQNVPEEMINKVREKMSIKKLKRDPF